MTTVSHFDDNCQSFTYDPFTIICSLRPIKATQLKIQIPSRKVNNLVPVSAIDIHSSYEQRIGMEFSYFSGDVAILTLLDRLDMSDLDTACLPYEMSTIEEEECFVTGKGYLRGGIGKWGQE